MSSQPYLSLIIPAYNEAGRIVDTLAAARKYLDAQPYAYEVIVAADGTDGTREAAEAYALDDPRFAVIGSPDRRGKGRGVREGMMLASGHVVGFVDADDKTPIDELGKVLPWFERGYDLVIGSRALHDSTVERRQPLYRQVGSKAFAGVMRLVVGLRGIADTQCGFKFFRSHVARDLFARQVIDGYMFDVEVLHLARRRGYQIKEVGVRWRDDGDTRYDPIAGTWRNAGELLRIRFGRRAA